MTLSKKATLLDSDGYIQKNDVEVCDHGDTISINGTEHLKSDLLISSETIESKISGWSVAM